MNLTRQQALAALDVLVEHGYTVAMEVVPQRRGVVVPNHVGPLYRVAVAALHFEDVDLRQMCDLAESVGLHCRYSLQAIRFEAGERRPEGNL